MKKLTLLFLVVCLFPYLGDSLYAQRSAGKAPTVGQTRAPSQAPGQVRRPDVVDRRPDVVDRRPDRPDRSPDVVDRRPDRPDRRPDRVERRPDRRVAGNLERNPQLASRLEKLLPSGMTLSDGAADFKNRGQFISALHVSNNLGIPFDQLKSRMTGERRVSLGQAISDLRPELSESQVKAEVKKADVQAKAAENQAKAEAKKAAAQAKAANGKS